MPGSANNPLGLSDEDFMNQASSPVVEESGNEASSTDKPAEQQSEQQENPDNAGKPDAEAVVVVPPVDETKEPEDGKEPKPGAEKVVVDPSGSGEAAPGSDATKDKPATAGAGAAATETKPGDKPADKPAVEATQEPKTAPDYKSFYDQIMTPFTANGKKIELKNPKEAIQLMQMGANYTRKLQEIAPHRKMITMLGNHGLLDESKLSFLIALDKKDPEAIKKLIMESGIDPLDIDTKIEPAYQEGSYTVSDNEVAFRTQLEDLTSTDMGKQTLQAIDADWDQVSKDMLWQNPQVMPIIRDHRENGIYAKITGEMDRRRTLGQLLPTTPFLEAYKAIGDELQASGVFAEQSSEQGGAAQEAGDNQGSSAEKPAPVVVATRAAEPRPTVDNGDKAGAASPSRAAPGKAKEAVNFLSMSDDDFIKANGLEGRV